MYLDNPCKGCVPPKRYPGCRCKEFLDVQDERKHLREQERAKHMRITAKTTSRPPVAFSGRGI